MNTQLIPVFAGEMSGVYVQLVDARLLHSFLEVVTRFNDWIKDRISEYGFTENQDFLSFTEKSVKPKGGRPATEYHLTLDMAKELSMVERNDKGRQARRYFIDCERKLLTSTPLEKPEVSTNTITISLDGGVSMLSLIFEGKADTSGHYFVDWFSKAVSIKPITGGFVATSGDLAKLIGEPGGPVSKRDLLPIIQAAVKRIESLI